MQSLIFSLLLWATFSGGSASNDNDIREAIIRHELARYPDSSSIYFVGLLDQKFRAGDPSDEFMKRFAGDKPKIAKLSESKLLSDQGGVVVDSRSGKKGARLTLGEITRKSEDEVQVSCSWYEALKGAGGWNFILKRVDNKWKVKEEVPWIPG